MKSIIPLVMCFNLLTCMHQKSTAQPFSLSDRIEPKQLELLSYMKDDPKRKGTINVTEVTQESDTLYYFVKGISVYSPVFFSLTTGNDAEPVHINICKENWSMVHRSGETNDKGSWETKFKTEGDFGIMVVSPVKPANYTLVTWVGEEAKDIGMTTPFKEADTSIDGSKETGSGFFKTNLLYIIIGLLVIGIIVLLILRKKK